MRAGCCFEVREIILKKTAINVRLMDNASRDRVSRSIPSSKSYG